MRTFRRSLPLLLLALFAVFHFRNGIPPEPTVQAQSTATTYDCNFTMHFTGTGTGTGQPNSSASRPCISWAITFTTTGFTSATVQFETSPDNSTWTPVTNTVCSSTVFAPCVIAGANPITPGKQGTGSYAAYGKYVRINVTSISGTGTGDVIVYGYKGLSARSSPAGGGGGGGGTVTSVSGTGPIVSSGGNTPAISINNFTGDSGSGGAKGSVPAPAAGDSAAGKFLAAGGGWSVPAGGGTVTSVSATAPIVSSGGNTPAISIDNFTGDSGSGGAKGSVPAPAAGDSAAGKFLAAGGGWSVPAGGTGSSGFQLNQSATGAPTASLPTTGWTVFNPTNAIFNDSSLGVTNIRVTNDATLNLRGITRSLSIPYTLYAMVDCVPSQAFVSSQICGIGITDGTKYQTIEALFQASTDIQLRVQNWTNVTTAGTTPAGPTIALVNRLLTVKIVNNSTNRIYSYWSNGAWVQFLSQASGTTLTETGFAVALANNQSNSGNPLEANLLFWAQ